MRALALVTTRGGGVGSGRGGQVTALIPYAEGELLNQCHTMGAVVAEEFGQSGVRVEAKVPRELAGRLGPFRVGCPPLAAAAAARGGARGGGEAEVDWAAVAKKRQ